MAAGSIAGLAGVLIWTEADRFPAMARFYRDTLGLTPRSAKEDFINFDWSGVRLSVGVHDRVRGASRESLRIMLNLTVADIRAVHERLARAPVGGLPFVVNKDDTRDTARRLLHATDRRGPRRSASPTGSRRR